MGLPYISFKPDQLYQNFHVLKTDQQAPSGNKPFGQRDVDGFYQNLVAKGVKFEREPAYSGCFNVYSCLFIDPNGCRIEIEEFRDKKWKIRPRSNFNTQLTNSIKLEFTFIPYSNFLAI